MRKMPLKRAVIALASVAMIVAGTFGAGVIAHADDTSPYATLDGGSSGSGTVSLDDQVDQINNDISNASAARDSATEKLNALTEKINTLKGQGVDLVAAIGDLDSQIAELDKNILLATNAVDAKEVEIVNAQNHLYSAQSVADEQYDEMKMRIKFMYENSKSNYLTDTILTGSDDFKDMLQRVEYISQMTTYDRNQLTAYQNTVNDINSTLDQLNTDQADLIALQEALAANQESLRQLHAVKSGQLDAVNQNLEETQITLAQVEDEINSANRQLASLSSKKDSAMQQLAYAREQAARAQREQEAKKAQQDEAKKAAEQGEEEPEESSVDDDDDGSGGTEVSDDSWLWPTPSKRITTYFATDYGLSTAHKYHQGTDIGATTPGVWGDPVYATNDGVVITAGMDGATVENPKAGAGNWIWILHGTVNGQTYVTAYYHLGSEAVSEGDYVTKGQLIGTMGSTGNSTGAHLHFGLYIDDVCSNVKILNSSWTWLHDNPRQISS